MYVPTAFREPDVGANLDFVEQQGFGTLISTRATRPAITHLPVLVDRDQGRLCMLVFSAPHCYVSAGWYREKGRPWLFNT